MPPINKPYPSPFRGTAKEIENYHLLMADFYVIAQTVNRYMEDGELRENFLIYDDDTFQLTEWCVREVVARAFPMIPVTDHGPNDKFQHFFDSAIDGHHLRYKDLLSCYVDFETKIRVIKVMYLGHRTIIAVGM
jgi:hypothetical protein